MLRVMATYIFLLSSTLTLADLGVTLDVDVKGFDKQNFYLDTLFSQYRVERKYLTPDLVKKLESATSNVQLTLPMRSIVSIKDAKNRPKVKVRTKFSTQSH